MTEEEIYAELGSAEKVAAELNEQMKEFAYRKSPWRWLSLALAVFSGLCLVYHGLAGLLLVLFNKAYNASIGIIGGADGPTSVFVTTTKLYSGLPAEAIYVLLLIMGVVGFIALGKLKQK